jgi:putative phage-type endonuclease
MHHLTDQETIELELEIYLFISEYLEANSIEHHDPLFYDKLVGLATDEYLSICACMDIYENADDYDEAYTEIRDKIGIQMREYLNMLSIPRRQYLNPRQIHYSKSDGIDAKIAKLRSAYQPAQRTPEWYAFRNNLVTASNIWKIFGSDANYNSLICEKCRPDVQIPSIVIIPADDDDDTAALTEVKNVNVDSPLHWGVKYEPLSVAIYEQRNKCVVGQFGCIQHPRIECVGASPDGIVVSPESDDYGVMLEIKNVVNREITGVPSMAYWIQMQVQMEVCDLNDCNFIETQFKEYPEAVTTADDDAETKFYAGIPNYLYNGVILYFVKRDFVDNSPKYVYMPLDTPLSKPAIESWVSEKKREHANTHVLFRRIYWYCDRFSCVLVKRNRDWFSAAEPRIRDFWRIVEKERTNGYSHRLPKKRVPKPCASGCIIKMLDV